ncbi:MAG: TonB-dependent receptor [Bryobacterales bacterium]|nr:TonB-dependent receptor [Bryobacterales bacterium]
MNRFFESWVTRAVFMAVVALLIGGNSVSAQEVRASITGIVQDASGAAISGAKVAVTNVQQNTTVETVTNATGNYVTPLLQPGEYRMTVTFPGFNQYVRPSIILQMQDRARVDVQLKLGEITETVTVTDSVSMIESETASRSQTINNAIIADVPTQGRSAFQLAWAAAGVVKKGDWRFLRAFDTAGQSNFSVNGGLNKQNEVLLDGISNVRTGGNVISSPTIEAIQEFKVITNSYDATYGRTGGGTVSIVTKGGSNAFHGNLFEYLQVEDLNANQFELNRGGVKKPPMNVNTYGFYVGGPVFIPKFFDGRNRLFWTLSYEAMRQRSADPGTVTMPLNEWRTGDFSSLQTAQGAPISIYDPLTTASNGLRTQFAGNVIPSARINPVAKNVLGFYPGPTGPGDGPAHVNNYIFPSRWVANMDQWSGRLDYNLTDSNRVYFKYSQNPFSEYRGLVWNGSNVAEPTGNAPLIRNGRNWAFDWTSTLAPTVTFDLRAGLSRWETSSGNSFGANYNPTGLGFSSALVSQFSTLQFPRFNLGTYQSIGTDRVWHSEPSDVYSLQPNLNWVMGAHFFKFGADFRRFNDLNNDPGAATGVYTFGKAWTQANALQASATSGNELATFLLGYPTDAYVDLNMASAYQNHYFAFYFNDDWKLTSRLTVNLGLRWDYETPVVERYDRQLRGMDWAAASPIAAQATGLSLKGVPMFAGIDGNARGAFNPDKNNWQPRIGVAYRLNDKLAIRAGYGLFYLGQGEHGAPTGFSQRSSAITSTDGKLTPAVSLENPFSNLPNGRLLQPIGASAGAASFLGQSITVNYLNRPLPYSQQYSFDIQYELPGNILAEIGYNGNQTRKIPVSVANLNVPPVSELNRRTSTGAIDTAYYNARVPNPMAGLIPNNAALNGATIPRQRLMAPYPQFDALGLQNVPIGRQYYNGMQVKLTKRMGNGVTFIANYGIGKTIEQLSLLNNQDFDFNNPEASKVEKRSADQIDIPQKFVITGVWELPFGRGRAFGSDWAKPVDFILGGWSINANATVQKGWALDYPNANQIKPGSARISNPSLEQAFDTSLWIDPATGKPVPTQEPFTLRQFPSRFGDVRVPGYKNIDGSISKSFPITEALKAQFRFEMINATNTPWFSAIQSLDVANANFGRLNPVQRNLPRWLKLGLTLNW